VWPRELIATSAEAAAGTRARARVEEPWILGGVGAGLGALTRLPVGWIRAGLFLMVLGTRFWLGLAVYAAVALVVPHRGRRIPDWSNVVGLLRVASLGLIVFLSLNFTLDRSGIFGQGPGLWVPLGGLLLIGWVAVLSAGRVEPSDEDRVVALAGLPALALIAVLLVVIWLAPGLRADVVLDFGLVVVGAVLVLTRPRMKGSAVAYVPGAALALVAMTCAFSGVELTGGIGATKVAARIGVPAVSYSRALGTLRFDASGWHGVAGRTERVNLSVGIGNITIVVPQDVRATIDARLGHGQLRAVAPDIAGFFVHHRSFGAIPPYAGMTFRPGQLQINTQLGDGCLIVTVPGSGFSDSNC
jgi:phage shock protein PspC (stress-responsive transcriptional regulator)